MKRLVGGRYCPVQSEFAAQLNLHTMLYDQAQLVWSYLEAYQSTGGKTGTGGITVWTDSELVARA